MGDRVDESALVLGHADEVHHRLERSVAALRQMLATGAFTGHRDTMGMEVELDLIDPLGRPRLINDAVLARLHRADMKHELGQFNIEYNLAPALLSGHVLRDSERVLTDVLTESAGRIAPLGARIISVGMLPTAGADHLTGERISANPRYALMSKRMRAARHRPFRVHIPDGAEPVDFAPDSVAPEACATSLQLHLRVTPEQFADYFNAAELIAGVQVAVAANSPFLLARHAWQESRIPLLEKLFDTRGRRQIKTHAAARVQLGEGWIDDPVAPFDDLVRLYQPLFPTLEGEDPDAALASGRTPALHELRLHNGTVWWWNRAVYDVQDGRPHLRIENRVLPSGPTAVDMVANAAFYYGLVRAIVDGGVAPYRQTPFELAERNLHRGARDGLSAELTWLGADHTVERLVCDVLLPAAASGLDAWGIAGDERDRYLRVIDERVRRGRNGAAWQTATVHHLHGRGQGRITALHEMTRRYVENAGTGAPVHEWPLP
ncbi:hypothetical protein JDV09_05700 [Mycobacterium sp. Y57]|uniref:hypothetical protein n=1 Tax=Mycolicibacterium xanthum TaxID=2796469 RepID=UPI001C84C513|nr:hypothetical protein [Mycolicibacterium xanthum]MBX7431602.1 hypothetical protein [Mycolicibacterium xanthum]